MTAVAKAVKKMAEVNLQQKETQEDVDSTTSSAWWLSTRKRRSEWQSLIATGSATFTGHPRRHFDTARTGDPVLLYVSKPDHAIRAVGVVVAPTMDDRPPTTDDVNNPQSKIGVPFGPPKSLEVQLAFELPNPLSWRDILAVPALSG